MALRVLLADESSTIKKVFQLALQDFGVDVRPVNIGVDVASVAKAFKPDIVFADVLLQKKNGYDVCAELKQDAHTSSVPVVLMWSGFLELDEDKFQASQANAQLEKPFDVAALRKLVSDLVPRTQSQNLSEFLTFPKATAEAKPMPDFEEKAAKTPKPEEDFTQVPIPKIKGGPTGAEKYRINLKPEELDPSHIAVDYEIPADKTKPTSVLSAADLEADEDEPFKMRETKAAPKSKATPPPAPVQSEVDLETEDVHIGAKTGVGPQAPPPLLTAAGSLTAEQLEKIIREQSAEVIESVVWKVIPELATQIIERELNKLLKERDSHHL